jgi:hypothetical protein
MNNISINKGDIDAVKNYPDFWLPVDVVAKFMGRNPQSLREQARVDPDRLGFPVSVIGVTLSIPKPGFLRWCEGR